MSIFYEPGPHDYVVAPGTIFYEHPDIRKPDSFGDCPTSSAVEWDEERGDYYLRQWCDIQYWRDLCAGKLWKEGLYKPKSIQELREKSWLRTGPKVRDWHMRWLGGEQSEAVIYLGDLK